MKSTVVAATLCALFAATAAHADEKVLNLYTARHYQTDEALYANFTKATGIKVNRIEGKEDALLERIRSEGENSPADVLITLSRNVFRGESEREVGFRSGLRGSGREIVEVSEGDGIDASTQGLVLAALSRHPGIGAVYSPGGGNTATVAAFERLGRDCAVFIAHDLDADNRRLLREGRLSVVLHNDLRADARLAMRVILAQHNALPEEPVRPAPIQVITPHNLPG